MSQFWPVHMYIEFCYRFVVFVLLSNSVVCGLKARHAKNERNLSATLVGSLTNRTGCAACHGSLVRVEGCIEHSEVRPPSPSLHFASHRQRGRLSTVLQILIFLPLTLSVLSTDAFLLLSLLLFVHSLIHGTLTLLWGSPALSVLQVPVHSFLLLVCFNAFAQSVHPWLVVAATWWGAVLRWSSPGFIVMEGVSSLLVVQRLGQIGQVLVGEGETYQFGLLIAAAAAYVTSAWWIVVVRNRFFSCGECGF